MNDPHRAHRGTGRAPAGVVVAVVALLLVAAAIVWLSRRAGPARHAAQTTSPAPATATSAATTQAIAATKPAPVAKTWLDVVRANYAGYAATQPLDLPADLHDAARVVVQDPIYVCGRQDLWVTRSDAEPTDVVLKRAADEQVHVVPDRVLYVRWTLDDKGRQQAGLIVSSEAGGSVELVASDARRALATVPRDADWSRAMDINDDVVVPTATGVAVIHLGAKDNRPPDVVTLRDQPPAKSGAPPIEVARGAAGLIAWIPWDNGKPGSKGAARYAGGNWTKLDSGAGWPEKIVHVMMLLDGSVARLFVADDGSLDVSIALFEPSATTSTAQNGAQPIDEQQVTALVTQLSDVDADKRQQAYAQLTRYGPGIFPLLEKLSPQQPPEARARIDELLKAKVAPTLGGVTLNGGAILTAARPRDGGCVLYADAGVTDATAGGDGSVVAPAWIAIRPNWPVRVLPEAMVHELQPGKQRLEAMLDEWVVSDDVQGPRRFVGNHFEPLMRKADRAKFTEWIGLDRQGRWLFRPRSKDGAIDQSVTLLLDPTIPDPTPRLPVWLWPTDGGKVGWTVDNWPAVQKGGTWVLAESGWRPIDPAKEKFITDLPEAPPVPATDSNHAGATAPDPSSQPTTRSSSAPTSMASSQPASRATSQPVTLDGDYPIFTDTDGTRYYDGQKSLKIRAPDGHVTTWPLPVNAVGTADAWLVRTSDRFFLFNQTGRMLRLIPTPGEAEPFKIDAVFTRNIPNTDSPQRIWLDPAGRIIIAWGDNFAILFPTGRIPGDIAKMMTGQPPDDDE